MAVLVDPPAWPAHGRLWSHLVSDTSFEELHAFARAAGLPHRAFEGDHYDVPAERYDDLVGAGAVPVASRELLRRLTAAGLRRPKRRGERVVGSVHVPGARVDAVVSALLPPASRTTDVRALDADARGVAVLRGQLPVATTGEGRPLGHLRTTPDGGRLADATYAVLVGAARAGLGRTAPDHLLDPAWRVLVEAVVSARGPRAPR